MQLKTKSLKLSNVELKMDDETKEMTFKGYASKFGGVDTYGDRIAAGAYKRTLENRERPVMMLYNHFGNPIGKWTKMLEDDKGLYVEGELTPNHSKAADVYASMKHGTLGGLSIGFYTKDYEMQDEIRVLKDIELIEISVVDQPADLGATIDDVKSALDECRDLKSIENLLREAGGFSKSEAVSVVSRVRSIVRSESENEQKTIDELKAIFRESSAA